MFSTFTEWVDSLLKAAGHKYIKRVPYTSGGKTRYRYIYHVTHTAGGKHVLDPEHMVQGAAFMLSSAKGSEVHAHITKVDGDMVTYRLDDGPKKGDLVTESKSKLAARLNEEHGVHEALAGAREKQAKVVADLKARGASDKQVAREQARLERLSVSAPAPKSEEPKKRAAKKPKSVEPAGEPKSAEPAAEGREGANAERRTMAFFDHPDATEVMQRLGLEPDSVVGVDRDTLRYAYDVESVKTTKQTLPYDTTEGVTEREYNVLPQFDNPMFALYVEDGRLVALAKSGENAGQKGNLSHKLGQSALRVLLHTLASDPQAVAQFAGVKDISSLSQFKGAVESVLGSDEHLGNVGKYNAAPTQGTRRHMAAVAQLLTTNIEQQRTPPVQNTTGEYASDAAIPKGLQTALKSFVSKDKSRADMLEPFHRGGHMYATDGHRAIRVAVQSAPTEDRGRAADRVFADAQKSNKPTVTLDASTAKSIADVCKALGADVPVEITTMSGKTMFRAGGVTFATVDSHTESAPTQYVGAKYLADMVSVEQPVTILQAAAGPISPLSAHTANTQQLLMPRRP